MKDPDQSTFTIDHDGYDGGGSYGEPQSAPLPGSDAPEREQDAPQQGHEPEQPNSPEVA